MATGVRAALQEFFGEKIFRDQVTFKKGTIVNFMGGYEEGKWYPYTPTLTGFGTPTSVSFFWKREGGSLHGMGKVTSGTSTGVEAQATLPLSLTSDATLVPNIRVCGVGVLDFATAVSVYCLIESGVGYITFGLQSATRSSLVKVTGSTLISAGNIIAVQFELPVSGWN